MFAYTRQSVGNSLEGNAGHPERQVNTIEQSNSSAYAFYENQVIYYSERDIPSECPTTVTLVAPWAEIVDLTADKICVAVLPLISTTPR
jgi:hypothetical protein